MDPSQPHQDAPAERHSRGISGDAPMNNTQVGPADYFKVPFRQANPAGALVPTPPSPEPDIHYRSQYRNIAPAPIGSYPADGEHPPTPPRHDGDGEYSQLQQWYDRQGQRGAPAPAYPQHVQPHYFSQPQYPPAVAGAPPRLHPSANLLHSSPPPEPQVNRPLLSALPPVQQWATHSLKIDKKPQKKKGEEKAKQPKVSQSIPAPATRKLKRKAGLLNALVAPTPPPSLRYDALQQQRLASGYQPRRPPAYTNNMGWADNQPYQSPYHLQEYPPYPGTFTPYLPTTSPYTCQPPQQAPPPLPPPLPPPNPHAYQHITGHYEDYQWPVMLYEIHPNRQYDFAQSFIESFFDQNIYSSSQFKWHAHTSPGFIKDGNRRSLIVLHNAANPFTWGIDSINTSTIIGVYGRHAHEHDEIRWTTIAPGLKAFFQTLIDQEYIRLKLEWRPDMKASEKRFHRAYWLAANRLPLRGLLNHGLEVGPVHDQPVEVDEGVVFSVEDLSTGWDGEDVEMDGERSARMWQGILDEMERYEFEELGGEYMDIGGSERVHPVGD